jgi:hypothetical protein
MSEVQTTLSSPRSKRRPTRSSTGCGSGPAWVVTGTNPRGLIPTIPAWRISFATVLADTCSPASARSARIRGEP